MLETVQSGYSEIGFTSLLAVSPTILVAETVVGGYKVCVCVVLFVGACSSGLKIACPLYYSVWINIEI